MKRTITAIATTLLAASAFAADITATITVTNAHQARALAAIKAAITAENPENISPTNAAAQAWLNRWLRRALVDLTLRHEQDAARAAAEATVTPITPN